MYILLLTLMALYYIKTKTTSLTIHRASSFINKLLTILVWHLRKIGNPLNYLKDSSLLT